MDSLPAELHKLIAMHLLKDGKPCTDIGAFSNMLSFSLTSRYHNAIAQPLLERLVEHLFEVQIKPAPWDAQFKSSKTGIKHQQAQNIRLSEYVSSLCSLPKAMRAWAVQKTLPTEPFDIDEHYFVRRPDMAWYTSAVAQNILEPYIVDQPPGENSYPKIATRRYCVDFVEGWNDTFDVIAGLQQKQPLALLCLLKAMNPPLMKIRAEKGDILPVTGRMPGNTATLVPQVPTSKGKKA